MRSSVSVHFHFDVALECCTDIDIEKDDKEAIDQSNVVEGRTRGAAPKGGYKEPGDTEGLPEDDGTSAVAQ